MLRCYTHVYVQDQASADLLKGIGLTNVTAAGDTRFDRVSQIMATTVDLPLIDAFKSSAQTTLIVGSSWGADEDVYMPWLTAHKDIHAIIAPHEFDAARLDQLKQRLGEGTCLYSEYTADKTDVRYLIIDCFGLLSSLYRYADVAYVGGGFGAGLHNINEAAVINLKKLKISQRWAAASKSKTKTALTMSQTQSSATPTSVHAPENLPASTSNNISALQMLYIKTYSQQNNTTQKLI
jgi:3-deoxy-D-manno-octulosonic-acid transferase